MISKFLSKVKSILFKSEVSPEAPLKKEKKPTKTATSSKTKPKPKQKPKAKAKAKAKPKPKAKAKVKTTINGLYLAGGGIHPGPGVPMALSSGKHAAEMMLKDLSLI